MKTLEEIKVIIEQNNKIFAAASDAGKRILIAKDVIKSIDDEEYIAKSGSWTDLRYRGYDEDGGGPRSLQERMLQDNFKCQACGLGTLMLSTVRFNNNITCDEGARDGLDFASIRQHLTADKMRFTAIFSAEQLEMIETAFEFGLGYFSYNNYHGMPSTRLSTREDIGSYWGLTKTEGNFIEEEYQKYLVKNRNIRVTLPLDIRNKCIDFGKVFSDTKIRLLAIMRNIIFNDGSFVP